MHNLVAKFPPRDPRSRLPGCANRPVTGLIPIDYFNQHEEEIRQARRAHHIKTRVYWRGPRGKAFNTRREDATGAIIYTK